MRDDDDKAPRCRGPFWRAVPGGVVSPARDAAEWEAWCERRAADPFEDGGRVVARDRLRGGVEVVTLFHGVHLAFGKGPPVLFETTVFRGRCDGRGERYRTPEQARAGHARWVARVRAGGAA